MYVYVCVPSFDCEAIHTYIHTYIHKRIPTFVVKLSSTSMHSSTSSYRSRKTNVAKARTVKNSYKLRR